MNIEQNETQDDLLPERDTLIEGELNLASLEAFDDSGIAAARVFKEGVELNGGKVDDYSIETMITRHNSLVPSLEASKLETIKNAFDAIKQGAQVSRNIFGRTLDNIKAWFDSTGTKRVEILKRKLEETKGEPQGMVSSRKIAEGLGEGGRISSNINSAVGDVVNYSQAMRGQPLDELARLSHGIAEIGFTRAPTSAEDFSRIIDRTVTLLSKAGGLTKFYTKQDLAVTLIGGRSIFQPQPRPEVRTHAKVKDAASLKLAEHIETFIYKLSGKAAKGFATVNSDRIPVLTREQITETIEAMSELANELRNLQAAGRKYANMWSLTDLAEFFSMIEDAMEGELLMDQHGNVYDTSVAADSDDLHRLEWILQYCEQNTLSHYKLLRTLNALLISTYETLDAYVVASLKQYR